MSTTVVVRVLAWLLRRHPGRFIQQYGQAMLDTLVERAGDARGHGGWALARFGAREGAGLVCSLVAEYARLGAAIPVVLLRESRHAVRRLAASASFTLATVTTLALALAAVVTMFTLVQRIVLAPLPYADADRLVFLDHAAPGVGISDGLGMSIGLFHEYGALPSTTAIAMYYVGERTLTGEGSAVNTEFLHATPSLAHVLGVRPALGRFFVDAEGREGAPKVVVLSHRLWQQRFGGAADVIGRTLRVDGVAHEIVGVMPRGFAFPDDRVEFISALPLPAHVERAAGFNYQGIARLAPGATVEGARADQNAVIRDLPSRYRSDPEISSGLLATSRLASTVSPLKAHVLGDVATTLWTLLAAAAVVLLIAAANLANLFIVRLEARGREVTLRRALGAGRGALIAFHGAEVLLVVLGGTAVALALAQVAVTAVTWSPAVDLPRLDEVALSSGSVVFAILLAALTWAALTLPAAAHAWWPDAPLHLRQHGATATPATRRVRQVLVTAQVALALVLLASAGLLVRSFVHLVRADPGFRTENRLVFRIGLPGSLIRTRADAARWHERMLDAVRSRPGVQQVAAASTLPLTVEGQKDPIEVFGRSASPGTLPVVLFQRVAPDLFATLEIPLRQGRLFDTADRRGVADSVLINETLARQYFPAEDPIGKRIRPWGTRGDRWLTIVGVVGDTATIRVQERDPLAKLYVALSASLWADVPSPHEMTYVVQTAGNPLGLIPDIRALLKETNPELALAGVERFADVPARSRAGVSFAMVLIAVAASVALVLGIVGVGGVVAYGVAQRRTEIAVRLAVGATPRDVTRLLARQAAAPIGVGLLAGGAGAIAAGHALRALVFGVAVSDPSTYILAAAVLLTVAGMACWWPARRGARMSPVEGLRG